MMPYRPGQDDLFQILALADEITDGMLVVDVDGALLDDRPFIQVRGDVVAGRADDFDAASIGRMIGLGTGKGRQKRMMNVDDPVGIIIYKCGR